MILENYEKLCLEVLIGFLFNENSESDCFDSEVLSLLFFVVGFGMFDWLVDIVCDYVCVVVFDNMLKVYVKDWVYFVCWCWMKGMELLFLLLEMIGFYLVDLVFGLGFFFV